MAMSGSVLKAAILSAINGLSEADKRDGDKVWAELCDEIVAHIKNNAVVAVTVTSVGGVTTGSGTSGPGTGTGTIS